MVEASASIVCRDVVELFSDDEAGHLGGLTFTFIVLEALRAVVGAVGKPEFAGGGTTNFFISGNLKCKNTPSVADIARTMNVRIIFRLMAFALR